jgi:predicted aspartyl protease
MPIVYFPSLEGGEMIEVAFIRPQGEEVTLRLLVDSGFTGQSSFVLSADAHDLAHAPAPASRAAGALQGTQQRVIVSYHVPALSFQAAATAILADVTSLALPAGIQGLAGLRFLRHFRRWGAEQGEDGTWRFFLATE